MVKIRISSHGNDSNNGSGGNEVGTASVVVLLEIVEVIENYSYENTDVVQKILFHHFHF